LPCGWNQLVGPTLLSLGFAGIAYLLRGATLTGAFAGFAVAFGFCIGHQFDLLPVVAVFALTWLATVVHARRRSSMRKRIPRDGIQVLANIGLAPVLYLWGPSSKFVAVAVLAEAAADTVASELGQAFGGTPRLITTWRRVDIGANGGITLVGTCLGIAAACIVSISGEFQIAQWSTGLFLQLLSTTVLAATLGMLLDSWLGATLEPRVLNNDAVNFGSVLFTGLVGAILMRWFTHLPF
jgi:uncharacterized protein (TIGR00297 family)